MRTVSRIIALSVMGLLMSLPALGADEKDKKADQKPDDKKAAPKKDTEKPKPKPSERMQKLGTFRCKIDSVNEGKKTLRLRVQLSKDKWGDPLDLQATDDINVRTANPPPLFDDKGNPKKYTRKELRELKGDPKLPGYPAEFSDLKPGQYVRAALVKKRGGPRRPKDGDPTGEYAPHVSLVLIEPDPNNK